MKKLTKTILALAKTSKGFSILDEATKSSFLELISTSDEDGLKKLYEIFKSESERMKEIQEDFEKKSLKALNDYFLNLKQSVLLAKKKGFEEKERIEKAEVEKKLNEIINSLNNY